jgi:hypothetical protein
MSALEMYDENGRLVSKCRYCFWCGGPCAGDPDAEYTWTCCKNYLATENAPRQCEGCIAWQIDLEYDPCDYCPIDPRRTQVVPHCFPDHLDKYDDIVF